MILTRLEVRHFRNLGTQQLNFPPEGVAVIGDNAQGKTNLLEAIYYLESFRSFRGAQDRELPSFVDGTFFLRGSARAQKDDSMTVAAAFDRKDKRKKVSVDGAEVPRISAALGKLGTVVFSPADTDLVSGGPERRRRFLDIVLALSVPGYVTSLSSYRQALAQRNAALKLSGGRMAVRAWDEALVAQGARVVHQRHEWVQRWSQSYRDYCTAICEEDMVTMTYRSDLVASGNSAPDSPEITDTEVSKDILAERFRERLDDGLERDLRVGTTSSGPHRDELVLTTAGERVLPLRKFGSGGQRRTAALALRLTEAATIKRHRGQEPILLLDDAFAELDGRRSERIIALLQEEQRGQVILTAPRNSGVHPLGSSLPRWHISGGVIEA